jgi:hypothetical protein
MKKILVFLSICLFLLIGCSGSDPASEQSAGNPNAPAPYNPDIHILQSIALPVSQILALKEREEATEARTINSINERCDELGQLDGVSYSKLETLGKDNASLVPCFKNVEFWKDSIIYGQYRPDNTTDSVWFITDQLGGVHHLPNTPKKGLGFKNNKRIRQYKGKPVYLNTESHLTAFNIETDEEETIINTPVGHFVVIPKNNGEHIVYNDLAGGKIKRPDGQIDNISEINTYKFFYKNKSNDLTYVQSSYFNNMIFDATGSIIERAATGVPEAFQDWLGQTDTPLPRGPVLLSAMSECDKTDNLLICGNRGFWTGDSSRDIKEINWSADFGIGGANPKTCLTDGFIYYAAGEVLSKINRDLSASEDILTGFEIQVLKCPADNNLIIHALNKDNFEYEIFQLNGNLRTMITEDISYFITK